MTTDAVRCVVCGNDLRANQPMVEPPSYYRAQAEFAAQQEAAEPSAVLGVMAWIAQVLGTIGILLFCVLPVVVFVIVVVLVLFGAGRS